MQALMQREDQPMRELLARFEEDEIEATHHLLQQIEKQQGDVLHLISTLNLLLNNKATPSRQRRDQAAIARLVADSQIFTALEPLLTSEARGDPSPVPHNALLLEIIKLIGAICWQNPHFIDNIQTVSPTIIFSLLQKLTKVETIPSKDDSLVTIVNFFHSISLKEGSVRKLAFSPFTSFLQQILTKNIFYQSLESKKYNALFNSLQKFHSNVRDIDKSIYNALIRAAIHINQEYKEIYEVYTKQQESKQNCELLKEKIKYVDRRMVAMLKLQQKSRGDIFEKIDPLNFVTFLKTLAKIAVRRPIVLIDSPYDNKTLINSMHEMIKDIKEWREHLKNGFSSEIKEENQQKQSKQLENIAKDAEFQSQMQEQDMKVSMLDFERANDSYYEEMKPDLQNFDKVQKSLCSFSVNYFKIVDQTIDNIIEVSQKITLRKTLKEVDGANQMKDQKGQGEDKTEEFMEFQLQFLGSRLDRLFNLFMRLIQEPELMREGYYKKIIEKLPTILQIYSSSGLLSHIKTVYSLIPMLNNMTIESNINLNRYMFQKIEEDGLKTHLHLKITSIQNSRNLISDTIIKFCFHLSEYKEYLDHISEHFLDVIIEKYNQDLQPLFSKEKLKISDIELMRMMTKVVTQLFPNIHKCNKEELMRCKVYNYCLISKTKDNAFDFIAKIVDLICKHDLNSTEELADTIQNREEMIKTIFVKLIVHKIRTFFATIVSFYEDLRKFSSPKTITTPIGPLQIERSFMFEGHEAYVQCLSRTFKTICLGYRGSMIKEEVSGLLLIKLLDFRTLDKYQTQNEQTQKKEEEYREIQTKSFNSFLETHCEDLFNWLISNMIKPIHKLPMLVKKLLHYKREQTIFEIQRTSFNQNQLQHVEKCFRIVSEKISHSYFLIEGEYLNLGVKMTKRTMPSEDLDLELRDEVIRLGHTCVIVGQFMIESNAFGVTQKNLLTISESYINSLIDYSINFLSKFQVQSHCGEDTNYLIISTLWLIECYLEYKSILEMVKQAKKKQKKKLSRARRYQEKKKDGIKRKKIQKKQGGRREEKNKTDIKENQHVEEETKRKRKEKGKQKRKAGKQLKDRVEEKTLQKNQSKINLHSLQQPKKEQLPVKKQKSKENTAFQTKVEKYIQFIFHISNKTQKPLMRGITLQYILKFISINYKKNYLSKPPIKNFQLPLNPFLEDLLKIKISDSKTIGYHLILSRLGLKLISQDHVKIDYETGVKRYCFDNGMKEMPLSQFLKFMQINFKKPPNMPHLIDIIYQQPGSQTKKYVPFTLDNLQGFVKTGKTKDCLVKIREGVQLHRVTVKTDTQINRKKSSFAVDDDKKDKTVKLSQYIPQGDINIFITHLITTFISKLINEIDHFSDHLDKKQKMEEPVLELNEHIEPFNAKAILYTLHYLIRQSPSLAPWIAKFKCKKIILNALKNQQMSCKEKTSKIVYSLLNKYQEMTENISEIGFLQVLLRLASPYILNSISGLVFELCLDSTPLVHSKQNEIKEVKEGDKSKSDYISFGSVVRQKTVSQIESILFGGSPCEHLIRKASCINLMTVLLTNRQMSKLFLQSNFISKLYSEYSKIMAVYNTKAFTIPGVYLTKLYIPFFLQPISLLQELNIAFHHNKKLNKNQNKLLVNSLIMLTQESINHQLIPADIMKKNKFKSDWPFGRKEKQRKMSRDSDDGEHSEEDSFLDHIREDSDSDLSEEEEGSNSSDDIEEGLQELDRIAQDEESYVSFQSGHQSQLLNDQWDYSSNDDLPSDDDMQSYPQHDQRRIQQQLIRQLNQNDSMQDQSEDEQILHEDGSGDSEHQESDNDEFDSEDEDEDGNENSLINVIDVDQQQQNRSYSEFFSDSNDEDEVDTFSPREQLIIKHKQEEQFYQNVLDVVSFEKITVVPKISKIEANQVFNLRFFLQLYNYPQRALENKLKIRIKSQQEQYEEKRVEQCMVLLSAFQEDKDIKLSHHIEWNQVYRYDQFLKVLPMSEAVLSKMFTDQHGGVNPIRRRRNAVIHRGDFIEVVPAMSGIPGGWEVRELRRGGEERRRQRSRSSSQQRQGLMRPFGRTNEQGADFTIRIAPNQRLHAVQSQSPMQLQDSGHREQLSGSMPIEQQLQMYASSSPQRFIEGLQNDGEIDNLLRELNMNMTATEFRLLGEEIQSDIIQNYLMARGNRELNQPRQPIPNEYSIHNSPALLIEEERQQAERQNQPQPHPSPQAVNELAQARVREDPQMSPLLGRLEADPQISRYSSESLANPSEFHEEYRKMSIQHISKLNKDIMQAINKQGKNDSKFYELKDSEISYILEMYFQLDEKEHKHYPYNLIQTLCMNTKNLGKIVASNVTLLDGVVREIGKGKEEMEEEMSFIKNRFADDQARSVFIVKVLHLLYHLTGNYAIAMVFLKINPEPIASLSPLMSSSLGQKSSLEMIILMLSKLSQLRSPEVLKFSIDLIENITVHHFYKSIHGLISKPRLVETQPQDVNRSIQISEECAHLLGNLLQNDNMKDYLHSISRIIMRLSLNEVNLGYFIRFMEVLIAELTGNCLAEMEHVCSGKESKEIQNKQYLKIVSLMNIFFQMVISFRTYPTSQENHTLVLSQLRKIVEIQSLQTLCETAANHLFTSNEPKVQTIMGEILEVYFILYEIALATSTKGQQRKEQDTEHKQMAELGEIKQMRKHQSTQLKREEQLILGKFNLSKLWRQSISHPVFKTYINNCIKKKLNNLDQEPTWLTLGIFEVPIFKVAISTPHMLTFDNKRLIFKTELKRLRKKAKYHLMHMLINRDEVFEDTFAEIMHYSPEVLKGKLKIEFKDEEGQDAGGITREWFQLLSKKMFDPNYGLFKSGSTGNTYHPSEKSYINPLHLKYFKFIGRITGKALYDGYLLDAYFTPAFYKHILNLSITYLDMEEEDYQYFNSLKWIMDNSPIEDYLQLNFNYSFDNFGEIQTKELFSGGGDKIVTEENKLEYVQLISYAKMATSIKAQLEAFLEGFHDLIPHRLIKIFNEKQLEIMISGRPTIDIDDLRRHTELINYVKNDQIIIWLFEVLDSFDMELRTAFLQFVTGSSRVPVEGFKDLRGMNGIQRFNIHREFQEQRLPRAHTCFNQLDLPNYKSKQILIEKLMLAITEGKEGFHMI